MTLLLIVLFLLMLVCLAFLLDSSLGGLDFTTNRLVIRKIIKIIKDWNLDKSSFYDLGSCRGFVAGKIAKAFPQSKIIGVDDSRFRTFLARGRAVFLKNLKFYRQDIFKTDVSLADIVYLYLPQELMPELEAKLQKELKPGSLVLSYSVSFPTWQPKEAFDFRKFNSSKRLFLYAKT